MGGAEFTGIIPARAGFTLSNKSAGRGIEDHPRSRGVYEGFSLDGSPDPGSSPLARGLRRRTRGSFNPRRIIPARAGFTLSRASSEPMRWDHPRSRGVY